MDGCQRGIFLFGPGRIGLSLARLVEGAGLELLGVWGRREASLAAARGHVHAPLFHGEIPEVLGRAGMILLTVADGAIAGLAERLAASGHVVPGTVVCHCAGVLDAGVLAPLHAAGAPTGTMHPLQSVPDADAGVAALPGSTFSLQGDPDAVEAAGRLVEAIGARPVEVGPGERALYHAAAALAGNYLVTLLRSAAEMLESAGMPRGEGGAALAPMVVCVAARSAGVEAGAALTGPVARGDAATLAAHLEAIAVGRPADLEIFVALTARTIDRVEAAGMLSAEVVSRMRAIVDGYAGAGGGKPIERRRGGARNPE